MRNFAFGSIADNKPRVLVLGGCGFIGRNLVVYLVHLLAIAQQITGINCSDNVSSNDHTSSNSGMSHFLILCTNNREDAGCIFIWEAPQSWNLKKFCRRGIWALIQKVLHGQSGVHYICVSQFRLCDTFVTFSIPNSK